MSDVPEAGASSAMRRALERSAEVVDQMPLKVRFRLGTACSGRLRRDGMHRGEDVIGARRGDELIGVRRSYPN